MRSDTGAIHLPTGTVTFMFTDVEGSTTILRELGDARFADLLGTHSRIIRGEIAEHGGTEVGSEGDSHFAVFSSAVEAVRAVVRIQHAMVAATAEYKLLRVRAGLHTGAAVLGGDNYVGVAVNLASRISNSGHGGQIVISEATAQLIMGHLDRGLSVRSLGRYRLAGFSEPTAIHQIVIEGVDNDFPPLRATPVESRLPRSSTDFVGRAEEIERGVSILQDHRLLTLTGPGGTGKTRLALELARRLEPQYAEGAFFVALASINDSELLPMTTLEALGLKIAGGTDPLQHLKRFLIDREILLVLDNYEHLREGTPFVSELLATAPRVSMIATSRSPLRLAGERELAVPPLSTPEGNSFASAAQADGVRLFMSRAMAVQPAFELSDTNVATVAAITRSLDGLPLAIELAASRLRTFTPELVLERLSNQMLSSPSADLPPRQQTIVNAIGWSYDLLDDEGKQLFEKLSVFGGSFGFDHAEQVVGGGPGFLDGIAELVDQSLLRQSTTSGSQRFRMLTVIKDFAYAALVARGNDRDMLDRHAAVYLQLANEASSEILTSRQLEWLGRLSDDHDNLRAAFDYAISIRDVDTALGLSGSLWRFWQIRGHLTEGRHRIQQALDLPLPFEPVLRAQALIGLGSLSYWQGDWEGMLDPYNEALELARKIRDDEQVAEALYNLSFGVGYAGDFESAFALLYESLELSQRSGRGLGVARAHWGIGNLAVYQDNWELALSSFLKAIKEFSSIDAPFDLGWAWFMLAHTYLKTDELTEAKTPLAEALAIFAEVEDVSALALIFEFMGVLTFLTGDENRAQYFVGAAQRLKADTGVAIADVDLNQYEELADLEMKRAGEGLALYEEGLNASLEAVAGAALEMLPA